MLYRALLFCMILQDLFAQTQANLERLLNQLNQIDPANLKQARQIVEEKSLAVSKKSCQACFKNKCTAPTLSKGQVKSDLMVFVSFSLSEGALKQLYRDVHQAGGRLVMRGLYQNSFRKTQEKMGALGIAVEIDPRLFEQLQIQHVPSFVLMKTATRFQEADGMPLFDVLKGHVSLSYALERFREEASLEGRAQAAHLLGQLKKGAL